MRFRAEESVFLTLSFRIRFSGEESAFVFTNSDTAIVARTYICVPFWETYRRALSSPVEPLDVRGGKQVIRDGDRRPEALLGAGNACLGERRDVVDDIQNQHPRRINNFNESSTT